MLYLDKRNVVIGVVTLAVVFCLGIVIGHYGRDASSGGSAGMSEAEALVDKIMNDQFSHDPMKFLIISQALQVLFLFSNWMNSLHSGPELRLGSNFKKVL